MSNWRRWVRPGLAATILLAVVALLLRSGAVSRDIADRVTDQLAADGQGWAVVAVSGRSVELTGTAPSPESQELALQSVAAVSGVSGVSDRSDLLPVASPYMWSAKRLGRVITLTGSVPSEGTRNAVLASTRRALPQAEIHDEMALARGAPKSFAAATSFALDRLAGLAEGAISVTDGTLAASGVALDSASYSAARAAFLSGVPGSVTLGPIDVAPARADPFVWSASYDGEAVTLDGYVPNEVVHETLVATARATLGRTITDQLNIASGEPAGFAEAATFAINTLARFREGGVTLDGLTLDVAGVARSVDDYEAVMDGLAGDLPKGVTVVSDQIMPAVVTPYAFEGVRKGRDVVLTGYVPSRAGHEEVIGVARSLFGGLDLTDRVRVAAGEPKMDWLGAIKYAMGELKQLENGSVTLGDKAYAIAGEAASPEAFADLLAAHAHTLPASLSLESAEIEPPRVSPYRFVAERSPSSLTLAGYVENEAERKAIVDDARRNFGKIDIRDELAFGGGAPEDFAAAAETVLQVVARLAGGRGEIVDTAVRIDGGVYSQSAAEEILAAAEETLPKSFTPTISIVTRQPGQPLLPAACRTLVESELGAGRVDFDGSKADVSQDSFGLLDRLAATLVRCPETTVKVASYSDGNGSSSRNRDLTQSRAEAIVDYLVDGGVARERLTATGYGEADPVADNTTTEGRAANRRVEFTLELPDGG